MDIKRMRTISIIWGTILVCIVTGLTIIGFIYKKKSQTYEELETKIEEAAKKYVDQKFLYPEKGDFIKITLQELQSNEAIDSLKVEEEECDGYVIISKKEEVYKYEPYIKCSKYTTKEYQKS